MTRTPRGNAPVDVAGAATCVAFFLCGSDVFDVGYPIALPSRKPGTFPFAIEAGWLGAEERSVDTFKGIDADYRIELTVDTTRDDGHDAAPGADVELRSPSAELVLGYQRGLFDYDLEGAGRVGGPHAAVLGAKRAAAGARRNLLGFRLPGEGERDVPAVALAPDQHADSALLTLRRYRASTR